MCFSSANKIICDLRYVHDTTRQTNQHSQGKIDDNSEKSDQSDKTRFATKATIATHKMEKPQNPQNSLLRGQKTINIYHLQWRQKALHRMALNRTCVKTHLGVSLQLSYNTFSHVFRSFKSFHEQKNAGISATGCIFMKNLRLVTDHFQVTSRWSSKGSKGWEMHPQKTRYQRQEA